jgi:hypothetical protein
MASPKPEFQRRKVIIFLSPEEFRLLPHHNSRFSLPFRVVQADAKNVFPIFEEFDLEVRIAILAAVIIAAQILRLSVVFFEQNYHGVGDSESAEFVATSRGGLNSKVLLLARRDHQWRGLGRFQFDVIRVS